MASPVTNNLTQILLDALAVSNGGIPGTDKSWANIDTSLKHEGKEIILPAEPGKMPLPVAIDTLKRIEEQENQKFSVQETVNAAPWDSLVAIYRAMQEIYGVVLAESKKTFFGEIKPTFLTVSTGVGKNDKVQVPMGQMSLPGVSEPVQIGIFEGGAYITGTVRRRDQARLIEIGNRARELVKSDSVYRGKAIRIGVDDEGTLDMNRQPEFIDLRKVEVTDMIHTAETEAMIRTNIFTPLRYTAACRKNGVPLKRGILLEGKYGTGKSLTARVTAKVATDNNWTFLMLDRANGLGAAIEFARNYQPCVIFAEDIDRAADREDDSVNDLVNLIDGVISKDMEVMVVLTTNFIDKIDKALLRPGRFDAVISIQSPDADTAQRLIRAYARDLLDGEADITDVGELLVGAIPATIREVVERAKLSMLSEDRTSITPDDLYISAIGMKRHMELLEPKIETESDADRLYNAFKGLIGKAVSASDNADVLEAIEGVDDTVSIGFSAIAKRVKVVADKADAAAGSATRAGDNVEKLEKAIKERKLA